jgi:tetratricopeptide (TPR) repeat protein/predicted Ser/Thr protein kinase
VIGEVLSNRYRVLREIGSGGMAWVYLAEDTIENRLVAVKVLYPQYSEDISYIQRFNREAKLAIGLTDPHIVRVLDYGASRDVHYLVMEYIQGRDLREYLEQKGALPYEEALGIVDQVSAALEKAHKQGIVHRDIKPQNLMMTADGTVKVLDFGIARARSLPSLTQSGFVGSPYYISPEQAMGEEVDIRSDIYSLGIVLYEMLSGRLPFDAKSPWSIISQHIATEPPELVLQEGHLPPQVEQLLKRTLAKRPEDRFQTPTELRQAVASVLSGQAIGIGLEAEPDLGLEKEPLLEDLYERAAEASQTGEWQRAVDLYNQLLRLNPGYKDAAEKLVGVGKEARLAALYSAANHALESGHYSEAADEFREIISVDPMYKDARDGLDKAQQALAEMEEEQQVSTLYEEGMAHFEAGEWAAAVECLSQVEEDSPGYGRAAATLEKAREHLQEWDEDAQRPRRKTPLGATRLQSRLGRWWLLGGVALLLLLLCGGTIFVLRNSRQAPTPTAVPLAENYNNALDLLQRGDADGAIDLLEKVVEADSGYSEGQAANILYKAYLERGDRRRGAGDLKGALADYQRALTLPVSERREAEERQAAVMQELSLAAATPTLTPTRNTAPTPTFTATSTATLPVTSTNTPRPKSTATPTATESLLKYPAPLLTSPENGKTEKHPGDSFVLKWEPVGELAADEYYRVYFESKDLAGRVVWGDYLTTKNPELNGEPGQGDWNFIKYSLSDQSTVFVSWWVTVMQATGKEGSKLSGPDISPPSDRWVIKVYGR